LVDRLGHSIWLKDIHFECEERKAGESISPAFLSSVGCAYHKHPAAVFEAFGIAEILFRHGRSPAILAVEAGRREQLDENVRLGKYQSMTVKARRCSLCGEKNLDNQWGM